MAVFWLRRSSSLVTGFLKKCWPKKGIDAFNGAQGRILYVLWQQDGVPIRTISEQCGLAITSLTTMLERMERQGLIRREADSRDKRKTLLYLTEKSRALRADYEAVSEQMSKLYYKGFTEDEITRFEGYLERIQQNLEEKLKA